MSISPVLIRLIERFVVAHERQAEALEKIAKALEVPEPIIETLKEEDISFVPCSARKAGGWGSSVTFCKFELGHSSPHSWVVT